MQWDETGRLRVKQQAMRFFTESFEVFYENSIAVDRHGTVTWISEPYCRFLGLSESPVGKYITEVIPNSHIPDVIDTGEPIFLDLLYIRNQWIVVSVIPLQDEQGKVVGGFGFVASENISQIKPLLTKYNQLHRQLKEACNKLALARQSRYRLSQIVGRSTSLQAVKKQIRRAANFDVSVLLTGETGTGKELFAHALHDLSERSNGPFISLNVAAIPDNLMEVEFFGAVAGAYTGASKGGRTGKFELANGGTLFLDEIGDMPLELQSKLLRVLQEKEFEPVGSNQLKKTDVRIVAATSRHLEEMVERGAFRPDLYYRISSLPIPLPPLRERSADIEPLCEHFIDELCLQLNVPHKELTADALHLLREYSWPGNIRELRNLMERACILSEQDRIDGRCLSDLLPNSGRSATLTANATMSDQYQIRKCPKTMQETVREAERQAIQEALAFTRGKKNEAARLLGISRANLYERMRKTGL